MLDICNSGPYDLAKFSGALEVAFGLGAILYYLELRAAVEERINRIALAYRELQRTYEELQRNSPDFARLSELIDNTISAVPGPFLFYRALKIISTTTLYNALFHVLAIVSAATALLGLFTIGFTDKCNLRAGFVILIMLFSFLFILGHIILLLVSAFFSQFEGRPTNDLPAELERRIRDRAYFLWQQEGCPVDRADEHWQRAVALEREKTTPQ